MDVNYDHVAFDKVEKKLDDLANFERKTLSPMATKWATSTKNVLKTEAEPPERPNQTYIRTGTLGRSWNKKKLSQTEWAFINSANQHGRFYPIYVLGNSDGDRRNAYKHNRQAWMHKGRWWIAYDVIENELKDFAKQAQKAAQKILKR